MVEHIMVAVDSSGPARHAARFAMSLARQLNAHVTLLTVLPPPEVLPLGPLSGYAVMSKPVETEHLSAQLSEIAAEFPDVKSEALVEVGAPADTIVASADRRGVDLIVMGTRSHLLGSVSARVTSHAHCPVTIWH